MTKARFAYLVIISCLLACLQRNLLQELIKKEYRIDCQAYKFIVLIMAKFNGLSVHK